MRVNNFLLSVLCVLLLPGWSRAGTILEKDARLAIIGDSITENKMYSVMIEAYLLACAGRTDVTVFQFGWTGEQTVMFAARASNDLAVFRPTVATTCYGMNDGQYKSYTNRIGDAYAAGMGAVIRELKSAGVRTIVAGSPGVVDLHTFKRLEGPSGGQSPAVVYNDTLRQLRDVGARVASENQVLFADLHTPMLETMEKAKNALGATYEVAGSDGYHPGENGHLIMAAVFLKALGCDGNIGTIIVDMKGSAQAEGGHRVLRSEQGTVEVESSRLPFCFTGGTSGTRGIIPFCSFNRDLNRFMLVVKGLDAPRARVTWGNATNEFSRDELATGVNLAESFKGHPFEAPFSKLVEGIQYKQDFETKIIKGFLTVGKGWRSLPPYQFMNAAEYEQLKTLFMTIHGRMDAADKALIRPVQHTIRIEAVGGASDGAAPRQ